MGLTPTRSASIGGPDTSAGCLAAHGVTVHMGSRAVLDEVSLVARPGQVTAIVGPNGAGKSTLLAVLAGDRAPDTGQVTFDGRSLRSLPTRQLARRRAVLTQGGQVSFPFATSDVVLMGRQPHLRRGRAPSEYDHATADRAMRTTEVAHLAERIVPTLSGGEQGRVALARLLAQETPVILLDEPSAALDLRHQQQVIQLCSTLAAKGATVVVIVHDLNHAAAADQVALLAHGRLVAAGSPRDVLTATQVSATFQTPVVVTDHPVEHRPLIVACQAGTPQRELATDLPQPSPRQGDP